jgi:hypothetical protein
MSREPDEFLAQPELYKLSHPDLLTCGRQCRIGQHHASVSPALGLKKSAAGTDWNIARAISRAPEDDQALAARAGKMRGGDYASCRSGILFIA